MSKDSILETRLTKQYGPMQVFSEAEATARERVIWELIRNIDQLRNLGYAHNGQLETAQLLRLFLMDELEGRI